MSYRQITLRTNILSYFLLIVVVFALFLIGTQYYFSKKIAYEAVEKTFLQTSEKIAFSIQKNDILVKSLLLKTVNKLYFNPPTPSRNQRSRAKIFTDILLQNANIYSIYIGTADGNLFEIVNMQEAPQLYQHYQAPLETRWTVIQIMGSTVGRIREFTFLDNSLNKIGERQDATEYQAHKRHWYLEAIKTDDVVRSDPYSFANLQAKGITYSKKIDRKNSVLAIDFTMPKLHGMLKHNKFSSTSQLFLFGRDGNVISSSEENYNNDHFQWAEILKKGEINQVDLQRLGNKKYFTMITPLSNELGADTYLGISVATAEMLQPYMQTIYYSIGLALLLLVSLLPVIFNASSHIVKPINLLMVENSKIKDRKFNEVKRVDTNIVELIDLSRSQVLMSKSIEGYQENQKNLMNSFIKLIAHAIDAKSSYTGAHCKRVPVIATLLAQEADSSDSGIFKDFHFTTTEQWEEFERGAWLHDCGKITTPAYVVDKATRLETINNRIHEIRTRFEVLWRDIEIAYLENRAKGEEQSQLDSWRDQQQQQLLKDFAFVAECNQGDNFMSADKKEQLQTIAQRQWVRHFDNRLGLSQEELDRHEKTIPNSLPVIENLFSDRVEHLVARNGFDAESYRAEGFKMEPPQYAYNFGELYNLMIEKGTLTAEERFKVNEHAVMTMRMLNQLPYEQDMEKIPEIAGNHHEMPNGKGYPRSLTRQQLSISDRIIAVADIFEALTATDRPYKKTKTVSETLKIMSFMAKDEHIDDEIFALFLRSGVYLRYAQEHLQPEQIDEVDIEALLG